MVGETAKVVGARVGGETSGNKMPTLQGYGTNLTKLPEESKLDSYHKLNELLKFLKVVLKTTPIGEPDVGKTIIAEGLEQRIANGDVSETIEGKKPVYYTTRSCMTLINSDQTIYYRACNVLCNNKVTDEDGSGYSCQTCKKNHVDCTLRYVIL